MPPPPSLRSSARSRFEAMLDAARCNCPNGGGFASAHFVLVVDAYTSRIVRDLYAEEELIGLKMATLDVLGTPRTTSDQLDAVYFVRELTEATVRAIATDFHVLRVSPVGDGDSCACFARLLYCGIEDAAVSVQRYLRAHVFSLAPISALAHATLRAHTVLGTEELGPPALMTLQRIEAMDYRVLDDEVFLLSDGASDLLAAFPPSGRTAAWEVHMDVLAAQLGGLVASLGAGPRRGGSGSSKTSGSASRRRRVRVASSAGAVARAVATRLAAAQRQQLDGGSGSDTDDTDATTTRVIVLDRSFDPVAPLVHASGFEAMVHDRVALGYTDKLPGIVNARHTRRDGRYAYEIYVRDASGACAVVSNALRERIVAPPPPALGDDAPLAVGTAVELVATVQTRLRPRAGRRAAYSVGGRAVSLERGLPHVWPAIRTLSAHSWAPSAMRCRIMEHALELKEEGGRLTDAARRDAMSGGTAVQRSLLSDLREAQRVTEQWNALLPLCCAVGVARQKGAEASAWVDPVMEAILARELALVTGLQRRGGSAEGEGEFGATWAVDDAVAAAAAIQSSPGASLDERRDAALRVASRQHAATVDFFRKHCDAIWSRAGDAGVSDPTWEALTRLVVLDALTSLCWVGGSARVRDGAREWEQLTRGYAGTAEVWEGAMRLFQDRDSPFYSRSATSGAIDTDRSAASCAALLDRSERLLRSPEYVPRIGELLQCAVDRQPLDEFGVVNVTAVATRGAAEPPRPPATLRAGKTPDRIVVFVVGGITHSEIRCAASIAARVPDAVVTLGGTSLTTGCRFVHDLREYSRQFKV